MDTQVENAIQIAWDPTSSQVLKGQAFEFLNQLREDVSGWQICLTLFTRTPQTSEVVRLVSIEIVNNAVANQHLDQASLNFLRDSLLEYSRRVYGGSGGQQQADSASLQNKLTQTLTSVFAFSYQRGWETFFSDFLSMTYLPNSTSCDNLAGTALYLRILGSVHDEIADVFLSRTGEDQKRNNDLKDLLRERDVPKIATSWQEILTCWQGKDDTLVEMCLKVIGRWVNWIDISLVVNQNFLTILLQLIGRVTPNNGEDKVRDAAIGCLTETVGKKMKPGDKMDMIEFLNLGDIVSQLVASPALANRFGSDYDVDFAEAVAKLVNGAVFDIVKALEESADGSPTRVKADQQLLIFLPHLLRFFSDEYDEPCSTVIPSLTDLLTLFRRAQPLPAQYSSMLSPILNAIITKMRYDDTASWDDQVTETDGAEFMELRKRLEVLQKIVAAVDQTLYIDVLSNVVGNTFQSIEQRGSGVNWRDIDLALHEMYLFGELAVPNSGLYAKSQPSSVASERLIAMMQKMIESGIASYNHPAIQLQYMEICVRYCSFFENQSAFIPQVLEHFVALVHHNHIRVRTRSWYLFGRFVKHLRAILGNVAETVITSISDLLVIKAEVPKPDDEDDMSSDESDHSAGAVFTSQLYLFEAVGTIASTSTTPVDKKVLYARMVLEPLFANMEQALPAARNGNAQASLQIHHIIMALGTLAHGFSDWTPGISSAGSKAPADEISQEFDRAAEAILVALESLKSQLEIRTAARFAFTRLVGTVGARLLPQLPRWISGLLSTESSKDEMAMFLRVLDQVVFGFKTEIIGVLDSLLSPLLMRIFNSLGEAVSGTDDEIQLGELRREYLTFLQVILNNDLASVLVSETNQGLFDVLLISVETLAKNVNNGTGHLAASRMAFSILAKMAQLWGGPDVATPSHYPETATPAPTPAFPGFDQFLINRFSPVCWEVLRNPDFRPYQDAQAKSVLTEIAGLQQIIYSKTGMLFIEHLQQSFFPSMGFDGSDIIRSMTTSNDRKVFANFLVAFLKQRA
ncbi:hypothetical protein V501_05931 [Pseudogymnoascus sp. VKM F-4519 (FW-2642)]|nr:hypothetical protein V501_05931 [Pseudogymnoascus sp. VKM F-4519 (FW-2642)]